MCSILVCGAAVNGAVEVPSISSFHGKVWFFLGLGVNGIRELTSCEGYTTSVGNCLSTCVISRL